MYKPSSSITLPIKKTASKFVKFLGSKHIGTDSRQATLFCLETMTQPKNYALEGGACKQVKRIIGQNFFLKSDINIIRQFFYQTEF
jgi:hypothetical protein